MKQRDLSLPPADDGPAFINLRRQINQRLATIARCLSGLNEDGTPIDGSTGSGAFVRAIQPMLTSPLVDRLLGAGLRVPTITVTGFGDAPTINPIKGLTDLSGRANVTAGGAGIAAVGTFVVTFSLGEAYGPNGTTGVGMLNNTGGGTWALGCGLQGSANSFSQFVASFDWQNAGVALTSGNTYGFQWWLRGR